MFRFLLHVLRLAIRVACLNIEYGSVNKVDGHLVVLSLLTAYPVFSLLASRILMN